MPLPDPPCQALPLPYTTESTGNAATTPEGGHLQASLLVLLALHIQLVEGEALHHHHFHSSRHAISKLALYSDASHSRCREQSCQASFFVHQVHLATRSDAWHNGAAGLHPVQLLRDVDDSWNHVSIQSRVDLHSLMLKPMVVIQI